MKKKRILLDVTPLVFWSGPAVGIIRVIEEIKRYIQEHQFEETIVTIYTLDEGRTYLEGPRSSLLIYLLVMAKNFCLRCFSRSILVNLKRIFYRYFSPLISLYKDKESSFIEFTTGDIFVHLSAGLSSQKLNSMKRLKNQFGVTMVSVLYDVLPLTHRFFFEKSNYKDFDIYVELLQSVCDHVISISDFSKDEFLRLNLNAKRLPKVKTIHLGSDIQGAKNKTRKKVFQKRRPYVLFVSTIEARKNHAVLLRAWLEAERQSIELPDLICVGRKGWLIDEVMDLYNSSAFLQEKVHFLQNVADKELEGLYKNCLFTVFPSFVEGWGLGVVESLSYGKISLISTAEALNEASQGIMPRIDPDDHKEWMNKIYYYSASIQRREELEQEIQKKFRKRTWDNYGEEVVSFLQNIYK